MNLNIWGYSAIHAFLRFLMERAEFHPVLHSTAWKEETRILMVWVVGDQPEGRTKKLFLGLLPNESVLFRNKKFSFHPTGKLSINKLLRRLSENYIQVSVGHFCGTPPSQESYTYSLHLLLHIQIFFFFL